MPMYDVRCQSCGEVETNVFHRADESVPLCKCGGGREHVWLSQRPAVILFREGWYEHLDLEPMYFRSKRKLKAELKERGLQMDYVE